MKNDPQIFANDPQMDTNTSTNGLKYLCLFVFLYLCAFVDVFISAVQSLLRRVLLLFFIKVWGHVDHNPLFNKALYGGSFLFFDAFMA